MTLFGTVGILRCCGEKRAATNTVLQSSFGQSNYFGPRPIETIEPHTFKYINIHTHTKPKSLPITYQHSACACLQDDYLINVDLHILEGMATIWPEYQ